ncbi:MAG: dihydroxyacetone kinase subunit L [Verrucomicrobiales bacterium]|jgi:dihydroxyacetone kinase-like protein|nr:dihydroxyacetone kinase subunit L [Verrucomicrobiales bacterium]
MRELTNTAVIDWLKALAQVYTEKKDYLTDLDRAIGDADHGVNMARGFAAVAEKVAPLTDQDIGAIFKTAAMTLISTVGGASGPLYGTFFLQAAAGASGKTALTVTETGAVLEAGLKGVVARGKAAVGDKTMIDALTPAVSAYQAAAGDGSLSAALDKARQAARAGAEATVPLVAKKGRASYLGERSAGHPDPGAESTALLFDALWRVAAK